MKVVKLEQVAQRSCGILILVGVWNSKGEGLEQPNLSFKLDLHWARGWIHHFYRFLLTWVILQLSTESPDARFCWTAVKALTVVGVFVKEKTEQRLLDLTGSQIASFLINLCSIKLKQFAISSWNWLAIGKMQGYTHKHDTSSFHFSLSVFLLSVSEVC